jgi:hypothetical protein
MQAFNSFNARAEAYQLVLKVFIRDDSEVELAELSPTTGF